MANYFTNTEAFAKNCVNKARPLLHCNGKCQLAKKLREEEKKEQQTPERKASKDEVVSSKSFFAGAPMAAFRLIAKRAPFGIPFFPSGSLRPVFHPPAIA